MKKLMITLLVSMVSSSVFAHGALEWIHCSSNDHKSSLVVKSEKDDGKIESEFIVVQDGKITLEREDVDASLKDVVKGEKVYDTLTIELNKKDHIIISVDEMFKGKTKPATAEVAIKELKLNSKMNCSALY